MIKEFQHAPSLTQSESSTSVTPETILNLLFEHDLRRLSDGLDKGDEYFYFDLDDDSSIAVSRHGNWIDTALTDPAFARHFTHHINDFTAALDAKIAKNASAEIGEITESSGDSAFSLILDDAPWSWTITISQRSRDEPSPQQEQQTQTPQLAPVQDSRALVSSNPKPMNNDGRETCWSCGGSVKTVDTGFFNRPMGVCTRCGK